LHKCWNHWNLILLLKKKKESGNDVHTHKRVGSTSSTNSLSSSGSNSNSLKINPFQKKDDKKDDKKEHICPSCGGTNTKTFGMVDEQKKKKKDEFKACLDCDITWKVQIFIIIIFYFRIYFWKLKKKQKKTIGFISLQNKLNK